MILTPEMRKKLRNSEAGPCDPKSEESMDKYYERLGWLEFALEVIIDDLQKVPNKN